MLEKQKECRDNVNYPTLEKMYNMISCLHLHQLDYKAKVLLFEQDNQPQGSWQEPEKFLPGCKRNQPLKSKQYFTHGWQQPSQRVRDQIEMDIQIAHKLQAEEWNNIQTFNQLGW